jgi:hypothetical protein
MVRFPGNTGNIGCPVTDLSRTPPPTTLAGGFKVKEQVYYGGASETVSNGEKWEYGDQGEVVGSMPGRDDLVVVLFPGNKRSVGCRVTDLSRRKPRGAAAAAPGESSAAGSSSGGGGSGQGQKRKRPEGAEARATAAETRATAADAARAAAVAEKAAAEARVAAAEAAKEAAVAAAEARAAAAEAAKEEGSTALARQRCDTAALTGMPLDALEALEREQEAARERLRVRLAEARDEERLCAICLDQRKDVAFHPCGHLACAGCAALIVNGECPTCKQPFTHTLRLFA